MTTLGRSGVVTTWATGLATLLATGLAGAVLLVEGDVALVAVVLVLIALTGWAFRSKSAAALDVALLVDLLYLAVHVGFLGLWPLPAVVAVLVAAALAFRSQRWELWRSWLRRGRVTPDTWWLLLATVLVTAIALSAWQWLFHGELPPAYRDLAAGHPVWIILLAGTGFSLVNAAVEEAVFRGVLQTSLQQLVGAAAAILVQAGAFGLLHVVGIPTGWAGALMAGTWGVLLGILRHRTQGILVPYVAHVAADLTIVVMLLPTLS